MNDLQKIREKSMPLHVLIVDDEAAILEGTSNFMKKFFSRVDCAQDGEAALKMLREDGPYDLVLTDIRMPKMSGWALVEAMKSIDKELFVAVMTGSPDFDAREKKDCDIYLAKPVDIDKMKLMLEMIIKKKGL